MLPHISTTVTFDAYWSLVCGGVLLLVIGDIFTFPGIGDRSQAITMWGGPNKLGYVDCMY